MHRHHIDGSERPTNLRLLQIGFAIIVSLALMLGAVYLVSSQFDEQAEPPAEPTGSLEGRFTPTLTLTSDGQEYGYYPNFHTNILLIGVDKESITEQGSYRNGGQADFLLLLNIDRQHRTITPIHIDRDTVTDVKVLSPFGRSAGVSRMQICLSHAFGNTTAVNCENTIWAVETLLHGIPVDHYVVLDMNGISMLNDELGGVTVTLTEDFSHLDPEMTVGTTLRLLGRQE